MGFWSSGIFCQLFINWCFIRYRFGLPYESSDRVLVYSVGDFWAKSNTSVSHSSYIFLPPTIERRCRSDVNRISFQKAAVVPMKSNGRTIKAVESSANHLPISFPHIFSFYLLFPFPTYCTLQHTAVAYKCTRDSLFGVNLAWNPGGGRVLSYKRGTQL